MMMMKPYSSPSEIPGFEGVASFPGLRELFGMPSEEDMTKSVSGLTARLDQFEQQVNARFDELARLIQQAQQMNIAAIDALREGNPIPKEIRKRKFRLVRGQDGYTNEIEEV